ncbi:MAG: cysteine desulfurase family protein [Elusimicrobiota bacterium]
MIYLDYNASTPVHPKVMEKILPYFQEDFANASSVHQLGQKARKAVEDARAQLAQFIGADSPDEIIFTSGGTEANNMAIKGALASSKKGKRIVSSAIEHSAVRTVLKHLAEEEKIDNVIVPVERNGIIGPDHVDDAITPDTALVCIMAANNELGTIQPIAEIAEICQKKQVPFLVDAIQLAGKKQIRVKELGADFLSLSGHKFGGPKGVGILYIKKGTRVHSLIEGGKQEKNRRGGTENVPGIVGMGAAAEIVSENLSAEAARISWLRDLFEDLLLKSIPLSFVNGDKNQRICNTSNICFPFTESSTALMALDLKGIACSSGSACAAGSVDPSHVLLAIGLEKEQAHASLRFSLGHQTTEEQIREAVKIITETITKLRENHPLWKKGL